MSESNLENVLARVADDLSSAAEAIRDEVAHHADLLAPDSWFPDDTAGPQRTILTGQVVAGSRAGSLRSPAIRDGEEFG